MRTMGKKQLALITALLSSALGAAFTSSPDAAAQVKARAARGQTVTADAGGVEPLRTIGGQMQGRTISGKFMAKGRQSDFAFVVKKAEMVDGKLQLSGEFRMGRAASAPETVNARIAGTMAKAVNPWPEPSDNEPRKDEAPPTEQKQGRETKSAEASAQLGQLAQSTQDTARKTPPAPGERTEQTQSLYSQAEPETGCGIFFLSMQVSPRLRAAMGAGASPVQLGVLLSPINNRMGEEINRRICAIVRLSGDKAEESRRAASIEELNRLLASAR